MWRHLADMLVYWDYLYLIIITIIIIIIIWCHPLGRTTVVDRHSRLVCVVLIRSSNFLFPVHTLMMYVHVARGLPLLFYPLSFPPILPSVIPSSFTLCHSLLFYPLSFPPLLPSVIPSSFTLCHSLLFYPLSFPPLLPSVIPSSFTLCHSLQCFPLNSVLSYDEPKHVSLCSCILLKSSSPI